MTKESIDILEQGGAISITQSRVTDKNIITAEGPKAAKEFGKKSRTTFYNFLFFL